LDLKCEVKKAQKGNNDAFTSLITASEKSMYRVAKSILQTDMECADAIQESIFKAFRSIKTLKEPNFFKTWLIRILINECNKILQINKRLVPIEELNEQPKETENFEYIELHNAVDFLEEELKIVVTLYYFEDFPLKEVAAILNTAEGTIKSRLHRARTKLADLLKIEYEGSACCE